MTGLKTLVNLPSVTIDEDYAYITLVPEEGKKLKFRFSNVHGLEWKSKGGDFTPVFHHWDSELWSDVNWAIEEIQGDWEKRKEWAQKLRDILKQCLIESEK